MTQVASSDQSKAWQWLANGWHALRDAAVSAITYFTPQKDDSSAPRWSVLAGDVSEHRDRVTVELEIPGMEKADLDIQVHNDRLHVRGEKRSSATHTEGAVVITERAYGRFERSIPLPCAVTAEGSEATYKRGVLTVVLNKDKGRNPRRITVKRS